MNTTKWIVITAMIVILFLFIYNYTSQQHNEKSKIESAENNKAANNGLLIKNSDYIFNQDSLYTYELLIPPSNYSKINSDPTAEEYVEARLVFKGDTIGPVGVRYKGSVGAFIGCLSDKNTFNPSGFKTCTKLSMKVKMNWENYENEFYELKKLQFHAMNLDQSQLRERLGYYLFRAMDVPAPRCVHACLKINGKYVGLFALVEQIDKKFTKYNFSDHKGNLYKEVWPFTCKGNPQEKTEYISALKTNKSIPNVELIDSFAHLLNNTNFNKRKEVVSSFMDITELLSYTVVDRCIRHDDGPFHWYCKNGICNNHNYYWYEDQTNEKLHLIPWDLDGAFGNIIKNENPFTPIIDPWGAKRNNCNPYSYNHLNWKQKSACCDPLIAEWANYELEYEKIKSRFLSGPFAKNKTEALLEKWSIQIHAATLNASMIHPDAISIPLWIQKKNELLEQLNYACRIKT